MLGMAIGVLAMPEMAMAATTTLKVQATEFLNDKNVRTIIKSIAGLGGAYLVLKNAGIFGEDKPKPKHILVGLFLISVAAKYGLYAGYILEFIPDSTAAATGDDVIS